MLSKLQGRRVARLPLVVCLALGLTAGGIGCASAPGSKTTQGAVVGGLVGAGAGAAIGRHGHDTAGILIGTAAGAVAGGLIGRYLENQSQELDAIPDATVTQQQDRLIVTFPGDVLFDTGSASAVRGRSAAPEFVCADPEPLPREQSRRARAHRLDGLDGAQRSPLAGPRRERAQLSDLAGRGGRPHHRDRHRRAVSGGQQRERGGSPAEPPRRDRDQSRISSNCSTPAGGPERLGRRARERVAQLLVAFVFRHHPRMRLRTRFRCFVLPRHRARAAAVAADPAAVRVVIESPRPGERVENRVDQAPIRGNAMAEGEQPAEFDVMLVIDVSGSTEESRAASTSTATARSASTRSWSCSRPAPFPRAWSRPIPTTRSSPPRRGGARAGRRASIRGACASGSSPSPARWTRRPACGALGPAGRLARGAAHATTSARRSRPSRACSRAARTAPPTSPPACGSRCASSRASRARAASRARNAKKVVLFLTDGVADVPDRPRRHERSRRRRGGAQRGAPRARPASRSTPTRSGRRRSRAPRRDRDRARHARHLHAGAESRRHRLVPPGRDVREHRGRRVHEPHDRRGLDRRAARARRQLLRASCRCARAGTRCASRRSRRTARAAARSSISTFARSELTDARARPRARAHPPQNKELLLLASASASTTSATRKRRTRDRRSEKLALTGELLQRRPGTPSAGIRAVSGRVGDLALHQLALVVDRDDVDVPVPFRSSSRRASTVLPSCCSKVSKTSALPSPLASRSTRTTTSSPRRVEAVARPGVHRPSPSRSSSVRGELAALVAHDAVELAVAVGVVALLDERVALVDGRRRRSRRRRRGRPRARSCARSRSAPRRRACRRRSRRARAPRARRSRSGSTRRCAVVVAVLLHAHERAGLLVEVADLFGLAVAVGVEAAARPRALALAVGSPGSRRASRRRSTSGSSRSRRGRRRARIGASGESRSLGATLARLAPRVVSSLSICFSSSSWRWSSRWISSSTDAARELRLAVDAGDR